MTKADRRKFFGSIQALQSAVAATGVAGSWTSRPEPRQHVFRGSSGEIVNWWPRTGTLQFQGIVQDDFRQAVLAELGSLVRQNPRHTEQTSMPF